MHRWAALRGEGGEGKKSMGGECRGRNTERGRKRGKQSVGGGECRGEEH